jgi:hypothetical protein
MTPSGNARLLAPAALATFLLAVVVVTATSVGGDDPVSDPAPAATSFSEGVPLQRLLELNPDLNPTALRTGQMLRVAP